MRNKQLVNSLFYVLQDKELGVGEIIHELKEYGHSSRGRSFTTQQIACILSKNKLFVKSRKNAKVTLWKTNPSYEYIDVKREVGGTVLPNCRKRNVVD